MSRKATRITLSSMLAMLALAPLSTLAYFKLPDNLPSFPTIIVPSAPGAPSAPAASTNGNYTVTYPSATYLQERVGSSGSWSYVTNSYGLGRMSFTGKSSGVYQYRSAVITYAGTFTTLYSTAITVTVGTTPDLAHMVDQGNFQYQFRRGDINGDGRRDLYIKRTSGGNSNDGVIYETILRQQSDGSL